MDGDEHRAIFGTGVGTNGSYFHYVTLFIQHSAIMDHCCEDIPMHLHPDVVTAQYSTQEARSVVRVTPFVPHSWNVMPR